MRVLHTVVCVLAAAVVLSACGGRGMMPSQNAIPGGSLTSDVEHTSPCAASNLPWYFHGACITTTLTSKGNSTKLPPYKGFSFLIKLGANTAKGTLKFTVGDALGGSDITGKTKFPYYSSKLCEKGNSCPGASLIYIEAASSSKASIVLNGASQLVITGKFPAGKGCWPAVLTKSGTMLRWNTKGLLLRTLPKGGKVTINIPPGGLFSLPPGAAYIDMVCS